MFGKKEILDILKKNKYSVKKDGTIVCDDNQLTLDLRESLDSCLIQRTLEEGLKTNIDDNIFKQLKKNDFNHLLEIIQRECFPPDINFPKEKELFFG
jgi:hypothetical protein